MPCTTSNNSDCVQTLFFSTEEETSNNDHAQLTNQPDTIDFSIVLPVCNEASNLSELISRLRQTLDKLSPHYELIFVDDGSRDDSPVLLEQYANNDARIKVVLLSRNFGQHIAASAGIDAARGRYVVWMDSDLQERPEDIPRLAKRLAEGYDVVYTVRRSRSQSRLRGAISRLAIRNLNRLCNIRTHPNSSVMRMFTRQVAHSIRHFPERKRFLGYLMPWAGYRSSVVEIETDPRYSGTTNYSFSKLVRHALTGLTSFSAAPLRLGAVFSMSIILACSVGILWVLYRWVFHGIGVNGWTSLIIALLALHAMQFAVLAVMGEYIGLVYNETKQRPLYLCRRKINIT